jgi:membrane protein
VARGLHDARVIVRAMLEDDLMGEAAKMAYFFFLSLFPLILSVFAITGIVGGDEAFTRIFRVAETVVPQYAWQFVSQLIREITDRDRPGVLSFGILMTAWAASNGIAALTNVLNDIYRVNERRSWWRRRLLALAVLVIGVVLLVLGAAAVVPSVDWLRSKGLARANVIRWPLAIGLPTGAAWLAYRFLPARSPRHANRAMVGGALVATLLWLAVTVLFRMYVANFGSYDRTYGAVGAVIALLTWFYLSALAVLVGGEIAAVLGGTRREVSATA